MTDDANSGQPADDVWAVREKPLERPAAQGFPPEGFPSPGASGQGFPPAGFISPGGYAAAPPRNGLGTAALVVGIIGLVFCWTVILGLVLGVLGLVFGLIGRGRAKRGESTNGGVALAGVITSSVALAGAVAVIVLAITVFAGPAKNLTSCLKSAGNDTAAQQQCDDQFRQQLGGG